MWRTNVQTSNLVPRRWQSELETTARYVQLLTPSMQSYVLSLNKAARKSVITLTRPCKIWPSFIVLKSHFFWWKIAIYLSSMPQTQTSGAHQNRLNEAVLTSAQNPCHKQKITKITHSSAYPTFHCIKWGLQGFKLHGHVNAMISTE